MYKTMRAVGFAALLFILAIVAIATPKTALADNPQYCDSDIDELTNSGFGSEVPVILVHGLSGGSDDWGSANDSGSFAGHINSIPNVEVADIFNYNTLTWFGAPDSGPKLAKTIDCVAQLSLNNGGEGKVIIVGYSQGGLVTRDALGRQSSDNQRAISDQVGQVVTIGTPHNFPGPPSFPEGTTVHTIAGDVIKVYYGNQNNEEEREQPFDDLQVPVNEAHIGHTTNVGQGGGSKTITCEKPYTKRHPWVLDGFPNYIKYQSAGTATCEHGQLITDSQNGVREDTAEAIRRYVATLVPPPPPPPPHPSLTISSLTTYYDEESWPGAGYGAAGPGEGGDILARDFTSLAEPPDDNSYYASLFIAHTNWWGCNSVDCFTEDDTVLGEAPEITVGGRTPDSSARYENAQRNGLVWCFSDEYICIEYDQRTTEPIDPSQALLDVFETARWSN